MDNYRRHRQRDRQPVRRDRRLLGQGWQLSQGKIKFVRNETIFFSLWLVQHRQSNAMLKRAYSICTMQKRKATFFRLVNVALSYPADSYPKTKKNIPVD